MIKSRGKTSKKDKGPDITLGVKSKKDKPKAEPKDLLMSELFTCLGQSWPSGADAAVSQSSLRELLKVVSHDATLEFIDRI